MQAFRSKKVACIKAEAVHCAKSTNSVEVIVVGSDAEVPIQMEADTGANITIAKAEILQELDAKYPGQLPATVFGEQYSYPETDGSGNNRDNLRAALDLFSQAGWNLEDGKLVNADGEQFALEIIDNSPDSERYILPWVENLERIGIDAEFRLLDPTQWIEKIRSRDFDMTDYVYRASYTPGTQMRYYWSSELAATPGSIAFHGYESEVLDECINDTCIHSKITQIIFQIDRWMQ